MNDIISLLQTALGALDKVTVSGLQNHSLLLSAAEAVRTSAAALTEMEKGKESADGKQTD